MKEIWKDAPGLEDVYKVSNLGNVMSISYMHTGKPKILKPKVRGNYLAIHRRSFGVDVPIHRLVAMAFLPNPNNLPCVNHKDEDKHNNFVWVNDDGTVDCEKSNLEWCDRQYNNTYGNRINKMIATRKIVKTHWGKVSQFTTSGEYVATFDNMKCASITTGINRSCINKCARGKQKTAGGFKWVYEETEHPVLLNYDECDTTNDEVE